MESMNNVRFSSTVKRLLVFSLVMTFSIGLLAICFIYRSDLCQLRGGVYATNGEVCLTESCYETKSCMSRKFPSLHCSKIKIGDSINTVHLHLGNAIKISDNHYRWFDAGGGNIINAKFQNNKLFEMNCNAS